MKAFTIIKGDRKTDWCYPPVGDLAYIVDKYWGSLDTRTCSTTALVIEIDMDKPEYVQAHMESFRKAFQSDKLPLDMETCIADDALNLLKVADMFNVGDIVRIKRNHLTTK